MELLTRVHIERSKWPIRHEDKLLTMGSCFSDHIARKLVEYGFRVSGNPKGTLYNPISIAHHMTDDVVGDKDVVFVTFGTAWVYIDKLRVESLEFRGESLAAVVDNCQKRPATDFIRYRLTVEDIVKAWRPILAKYSNKRFVFTVSPIRHKKDGLHENQISKGILLQAIDSLTSNSVSGLSSYFPSYEIMLDELRDYRFYAEDMLHPSVTAVEYIWERLADTYLYDSRTREIMQELHQYWLDCQHRMLKPDSEEAKAFAEYLAKRRNELHSKYDWIQ